MDEYWTPKPDSKVLHFAPERGLHAHLSSLDLQEYRIVDFQPGNFDFAEVEPFDLCSDGPNLPTREYDLIIHSHIMEHVPCNVTAVLSHVHRSLTEDGLHLMCVPFMHGASEEDLSRLTREDAERRFGQRDHVRKFGKEDVSRTIGMVFNLPESYELADYFPDETLTGCNIPSRERSGYTGTSVFPLRKSDFLLAP